MSPEKRSNRPSLDGSNSKAGNHQLNESLLQKPGRGAKRKILETSQPQADPRAASRPKLSAPATPRPAHEGSVTVLSKTGPFLAQDKDAALPAPLPLPAVVQSLDASHNIRDLRIISSSKIRQKVSQIVEHLSERENAKPALVIVHGKADVGSKVISVAEIAKRQFPKQKVYQYSAISSVIGKLRPRDKKKQEGQGADGEIAGGTHAVVDEPQEHGDETAVEDDDDAFETMRDPAKPANLVPEREKVRAIPVLTIYLSLSSVLKLKQAFG